MNIVEQTSTFVTTRILAFVKPQHKKLFAFGIQALSLTAYTSLGSNARQIIANVNTASSKIYRLVSNNTIRNNFHSILRLSGLVTKASLINIDFSTFCGFQVLAFAKQTGKGRSLPVWNNSICYPIEEEGSQNIFVLEEIQKFGKVLGFFPKFVFDRGFWIPCVMEFLLKEHIPFYLRIKKGQHFEWEQETKQEKQAREQGKKKRQRRKKKGKQKKKKKETAYEIGRQTKDARIMVFGKLMRLIVSPPPPEQTNPKKKQNTQRWYIVTNDMETSRKQILHIYKTRFEIEETFKDMKHIQELKVFHIKTIQTCTILLWFATIAFWLAYWRENVTDITRIKEQQTKAGKKKTLSFVRIFWEELQRAVRIERMNQIVGIIAPG